MKVAFIADIHGNLHALRRVLKACAQFDVSEIHCLGDTIGYFPDAEAVLALLHQHNVSCQLGNHESMWLHPNTQAKKNEPVYRLQEFCNILPPDYQKHISSWPKEKTLIWESNSKDTPDRTTWLIHGSPDDKLFGYVYPDTSLTSWADLPYHAVVMANTHRPFIRQCGSITFVNTGSVGLPRDSGTMASFALLDTTHFSFEIIRVPLNKDKLKDAYATKVHSMVMTCLDRNAPTIIGTVIDDTFRREPN